MSLADSVSQEYVSKRVGMTTLGLLIVGLLLLMLEMHAFRVVRTLPKRTSTKLRSSGLDAVPSLLLTVGDYAAEIEKSTVGEEVYGPIFKAGLFLFLSGVISAFIAAAIVTKAGTWESLKDEFDEGKRSQYIYSELENREQNKEVNENPVELKPDDANNVKDIDL